MTGLNRLGKELDGDPGCVFPLKKKVHKQSFQALKLAPDEAREKCWLLVMMHWQVWIPPMAGLRIGIF